MRRMLMLGLALLCAGGSTAFGDPYWIAYEGDDFPENQGWTRHFGAGGADRSISDGALVLESESGNSIYDYYAIHGPVSPDSGELFLMQWSLRADRIGPFVDPTVAVFSDDGWGAAFEYWPDHVESGYESDVSVPLTLGQFHEFRFQSWDMRNYAFFVDGELAWTGNFRDVVANPGVGWGDGVEGSGSLVYWDYFRFGVVPEPSGAFAMLCVGLLSLRRQR